MNNVEKSKQLTAEQIKVMTAFLEGEEIEVQEKIGSSASEIWLPEPAPTWDWHNFDYRIKPEVVLTEPTSWEEFCKTTRIHDGEAYVDSTSHILECGSGDPRNNKEDANLYPSKELAEAVLAQAQLLQLRRAYVGDWEPDWADSHKTKYCIVNGLDGIQVDSRYSTQRWLSFPDNEMAVRFLSNFRDLIETVKPLL